MTEAGKQTISLSAKERKIIQLIRGKKQGELRILIRRNEPVMAEDKVKDIKL